jgi:hypothetical protein
MRSKRELLKMGKREMRGIGENYHVSTRLLVNPIPLEPRVRHVLLIQTPRDALIIEKIH